MGQKTSPFQNCDATRYNYKGVTKGNVLPLERQRRHGGQERAEMCATTASCIGTTNQASLQCYEKNIEIQKYKIFATAVSCIGPNRQHIIAIL